MLTNQLLDELLNNGSVVMREFAARKGVTHKEVAEAACELRKQGFYIETKSGEDKLVYVLKEGI